MHDLLIRGASLIDGTGAPAKTADLAVTDGRIAAIGSITGAAKRTVDADGLALAPGIIDIHTHYDAQVTWDPTLSPSPALGVTTAVLGNCGFGIAPCPASQRQTVVRNLSVVEGMDLDALLKGTRWDFETFPEYMAMLRRAQPYANVAVLAQHSTIRSAVMGEAASTRAEATAEELAQMRAQVRTAMDAGAIGFASSFSPNHGGWAGRPMPSTIAPESELRALAGTLGDLGRGIFVMATGSRASPEVMESIAADTGRPAFMVTVLTMHNAADPGKAITYYERCAEARARGHEVYIHTTCQPLSFDFTLGDPYLLLSHDAFNRVTAADKSEWTKIYRDPAFRARFRENLKNPKPGILFYGDWSKMELEGVPLTEIALREQRDPLDVFFDLPLDQSLVAKLFQNDDAAVAPLLKHEQGVVALSDAGAHLIYFCDAGFGLHFLQHWVRELGTFTLEEGVRRLTGDPAAKYRIPGRGRLAEGMAADLLLFDPAKVGISKLERVRDLPGGGSRMIRHAEGVAGTWVNGVQVFDGKAMLSLEAGPGQVLDRFDA
ncbi:MAG TPA: amidohydrolase family protein [Burkholderiales bacterium]